MDNLWIIELLAAFKYQHVSFFRKTVAQWWMIGEFIGTFLLAHLFIECKMICHNKEPINVGEVKA